MSYKTILVHLNDSRRAQAVLEPTVELASRFNSHLIGVQVLSAPVPPVTLASATRSAIVAAERRNMEAIEAAFKDATRGKQFVAEWHTQDVPYIDLSQTAMAHGRSADLIVAGQIDPDWDLSPLKDLPEHLALESGRPVLVIPYSGRYSRIGRRVVIAWNATRESARATFDALPLLKGAETVHILEIKGEADAGNELAPDTSIAATLARHGIKPEVRSSIATDISVGDEILSRAADLDADLLVMGAYGHSRFRELVFGGATRHIARHMTMPTFFSH